MYEFASPSFDEDASANNLTGRAEHEIAEVGSFTTCSSTQKHLDQTSYHGSGEKNALMQMLIGEKQKSA